MKDDLNYARELVLRVQELLVDRVNSDYDQRLVPSQKTKCLMADLQWATSVWEHNYGGLTEVPSVPKLKAGTKTPPVAPLVLERVVPVVPEADRCPYCNNGRVKTTAGMETCVVCKGSSRKEVMA